jgi:hemerythrin-like metal-binding protein
MLIKSFEWTADDLVFVSQLDGDHQKVLADAEKVRRALESGSTARNIRFHVWRLSKRLTVHLASEERVMRCSRYPACGWHERQHQAGHNKMARLVDLARDGERQEIAAALNEVVGWIRDHVNLADRMLASHLRNDRRERLAS